MRKKFLEIWYLLDFRSDPDPQQADADPHHCPESRTNEDPDPQHWKKEGYSRSNKAVGPPIELVAPGLLASGSNPSRKPKVIKGGWRIEEGSLVSRKEMNWNY